MTTFLLNKDSRFTDTKVHLTKLNHRQMKQSTSMCLQKSIRKTKEVKCIEDPKVYIKKKNDVPNYKRKNKLLSAKLQLSFISAYSSQPSTHPPNQPPPHVKV